MIYAIVALLVLIADQAVKFWTTKNILLNAVGDQCVSLIDGVVHMTNVHNHGAAFGILQDARWPLAIVSAVFVIVIIVLINKEVIHTRFGKWLAVLVIAGALGNCIDRVLYGYVVDMFEVEFMNFAVFNVADIFITVCGILFCIHVIFHNEPEAVKAANEPEFLRRRREKAEAANAPYAAIPKRGEHRTLEEELAPADEADPFAEWDFGSVVEKAAPAEPAPEPAPAAAEPAAAESPRRSRAARTEKAETKKTRKPVPAPEPEPEPEPEPTASGEFEIEEFSLEDILSEFGDF